MFPELLRIASLAGNAILELQSRMRDATARRPKEAGDYATEADLEAERIILRELSVAFPEIPVVAEESYTAVELPATYVTVDPLDGTIIYSRGCREWGTTICFIENGLPRCGVIVYPALGIEIYAVRNAGCFLNGERLRLTPMNPAERFVLAVDTFYNTQAHEITDVVLPLVKNERILVSRALGSAVGNTLALLRQEVDVYYCARAKVWDVAACTLAVEEAGGSVVPVIEDSMNWRRLQKGQIFASSAPLAREVGGLARDSFRVQI